ncbi:uncharacterized protein [Aquarana catesbeiana]|uniref:uncharacterized protein isoform X3 n=1 Tax=Aquarana catesbeiana TaxID=8400 RepID=UPI003CC9921F
MNARTVWLLHLLYSTGAALQMTGPSTYEARVGSIAQIPCTFTADKLPADPRYFAVVWDLEGKHILSYDNIVTSADPRYSLDIDQALNGIAHLTISNTFLSDGGIYTCSVTDSPIEREKKIKVEISGGALQMTGPSTCVARVGSSAHIPCTFTADKLPADPKYFTVFWNLKEKRILSYDKNVTSTNPRYSLDKDRALNGIADLTIFHTLLSDGGIYTCLVNYSSFLMDRKISMDVSGGALQMTGPSTCVARVGSIAHIPCTFTADKLPADPRYFTVFWNLKEKLILSYDKNVTSTNPRYSLDKDQALNGIADLTISNTLLSDGGIYTCSVNYSSFLMDRKISMNVSARPLISILNKSVQRNTENNLTCMANGFFPNNINVTWYKDGEVLKNQSMGEPLQYDNETYQVNSTVTITPSDDDRNKTFSCRIQHVSLQEPLQEDFQLTYQESSSYVGIIISIVIVGVIIIAVVWWRRKKICRKEKKSANKTRENQPKHSETLLQKEKKEKQSANKTRENQPKHSETLLQKEEEKEKQSANKTKENQPEHSETLLQKEEKKEKQSANKTRENQPKHSETLLQKEEEKEKQSANKTRENRPEHSETLLQKEEEKAELPDPEIGEIMVPELKEGEPATLECRIYNFKEGQHQVKWHQTQEDKMINVCKNSLEKRDYTYNDQTTYIATLTLPAVQMSDCGTKYVCEVQFSGPRLPIQKKTEPIQVKGKDQASLQEGKDRCTKSPIAEIFAENNKPQLSDQQQTCKPEIKPRTKHYKEQPQCPLELKKDNIDTD